MIIQAGMYEEFKAPKDILVHDCGLLKEICKSLESAVFNLEKLIYYQNLLEYDKKTLC